jgi:ATP sulfurylase
MLLDIRKLLFKGSLLFKLLMELNSFNDYKHYCIVKVYDILLELWYIDMKYDKIVITAPGSGNMKHRQLLSADITCLEL